MTTYDEFRASSPENRAMLAEEELALERSEHALQVKDMRAAIDTALAEFADVCRAHDKLVAIVAEGPTGRANRLIVECERLRAELAEAAALLRDRMVERPHRSVCAWVRSRCATPCDCGAVEHEQRRAAFLARHKETR